MDHVEPRRRNVFAFGDNPIAEPAVRLRALGTNDEALASALRHVERVIVAISVMKTWKGSLSTVEAQSASSRICAWPFATSPKPKSSIQLSGLSTQWRRRYDPSGNGTDR
jgi:hypothetical protein